MVLFLKGLMIIFVVQPVGIEIEISDHLVEYITVKREFILRRAKSSKKSLKER